MDNFIGATVSNYIECRDSQGRRVSVSLIYVRVWKIVRDKDFTETLEQSRPRSTWKHLVVDSPARRSSDRWTGSDRPRERFLDDKSVYRGGGSRYTRVGVLGTRTRPQVCFVNRKVDFGIARYRLRDPTLSTVAETTSGFAYVSLTVRGEKGGRCPDF